MKQISEYEYEGDDGEIWVKVNKMTEFKQWLKDGSWETYDQWLEETQVEFTKIKHRFFQVIHNRVFFRQQDSNGKSFTIECYNK